MASESTGRLAKAACKALLLGALSLSCGLLLAAPAAPAAPPIPLAAVLPQPQRLQALENQAPFELDRRVQVWADPALRAPAQALARELGLRPARSGQAPATGAPGRQIRLALAKDLPAVAGAYRLRMAGEALVIEAAEASGAFYAGQTLRQLLPPGWRLRGDARVRLPAVEIEDGPRFAWRGLMLDVARHFHDASRVKRVIDQMAAYKLNRLHLHLSDDQGWRVQLRSLPRLSQVGGRGSHSQPDTGPAQFFSEADVREIVRYAAARHIEVVPEIDMPGHSGAAARAYPEFFDGRVTFNPAKPETYRFIDTLLGDLVRLFPGRYLHFGGDEVWVDNTRWKDMPDVMALARKLTPADQAPQLKAVEADFARRVVQLIQKHGRIPIGWDEVIAAGLDDPALLVQWWRMDKPEAARQALRQGQSLILSPSDRMYLDYAAGLGEPGAPWEGNTGGPVSVEKIVAWEPMPEGLSEAERERVLGIEAPLWTENVRSESYLQFMLYPRLAAVAEVAWRQSANSSPAAFVKRLAPHIQRWKAQGLNVRGSLEDAHRYRLH
ncbi:beta-N-acetylhexosaminidase [Paucibacter sp. B51]|uniref:beta-N-acetylhexosaminidase n=1 Tax=Paucibacter sp. B51 TaxID=2993315 RepID=UPI0022EBBECB|nr:beta-N-acetylhexosaminidase [Paucibacter sp. B51]